MRSEPRLAGDERISHAVIWAEGPLVPMPKGRGPAWLGRGSAQRALWLQLTEQGGEAIREEAAAGPQGPRDLGTITAPLAKDGRQLIYHLKGSSGQ